MLTSKVKQAVPYLVGAVLLIVVSLAVPAMRAPALSVFRAPLVLCSLIGREAKALFFFHHNYRQNLKLRISNDLLRRQVERLNELTLENDRLRQQLDFARTKGYKVIPAAVIGRDPSNWASALIVDKGRRQGVRKGLVAVTFLGLAGRVVEVGERASKIILINDPNLSVSCRIQRTRIEGLVSGSLGGYLVMKFLPKDCDIVIGDTVVTSGLTAVYPKGILVGTVSSVAVEFSGVSKYALIKPSVELSGLEEVLVIIP